VTEKDYGTFKGLDSLIRIGNTSLEEWKKNNAEKGSLSWSPSSNPTLIPNEPIPWDGEVSGVWVSSEALDSEEIQEQLEELMNLEMPNFSILEEILDIIKLGNSCLLWEVECVDREINDDESATIVLLSKHRGVVKLHLAKVTIYVDDDKRKEKIAELKEFLKGELL
jgi:hypothetical protein